jgi:hypothetical protein
MTVLFRCDGCGLKVERDTLSVPSGWAQPSTFGAAAGPHFCVDCIKRALSQPAAMVPVSYRNTNP